jgi:glycosyltransferase involved in cell wall biosynthesis
VGQLGVGGLERQLCYLLETMDRERYRPAVVVWNFREEDFYVPFIRQLEVPLHSLGSSVSGTGKLMAFRRMVMQIRPEVVHSYSFYTNFAAWWATLGTNAVAVGTVRSDFAYAKRESGALLGRLSARWPRTQIFNSSVAKKAACCDRSLFVPKQLSLVRNSVDLECFRSVRLTNGRRPRIVGVGSLLPVKRWDRLIQAASVLKERGFDFCVQIAGSGPLREKLQRQAAELGIADRISLLGHVKDIPGFLGEATFLTHTSDSEGCPNVIMEAMASELPVVATDAGDTPLLIEEGKTGFVVGRGDNATLVERMATLLRDGALRVRMGKAGRAKAEGEFGLDRLVTETLSAYRTAGWKDA